MSKTYIGIDPGSKGYICVFNQHGITQYLSISESSKAEIAAFMLKLSNLPEKVVVMEEVHAVYGSSAKATFSFGEIFGFLKGVIVSYGFPYHLVQPKEWQKAIWINEDKEYKSGKTVDTKKTSINAALRIFPEIDFRKTPACKNIDDNMVDATLIAEYARRANL